MCLHLFNKYYVLSELYCDVSIESDSKLAKLTSHMFTNDDISRVLLWLNVITDAYGETVPSGWDATLNVILLMADFGRAPSPPHIPTQHVSLLEVPTFPALYPWEQTAAPFLCRHARLFVHAWRGAPYPQLYNLSLLRGPAMKKILWASKRSYSPAAGVILHDTRGE